MLGVLPSVDEAALPAIYRALIKKYHPDVFKGPKAEAQRKTQEIIEAHEIVGNAETRRAYDKARDIRIKSADRVQENDSVYDDRPFIAEEWIDLNKVHQRRLANARRSTIGAVVIAAVIFAVALIGEWHPAAIAPTRVAQAPRIPGIACAAQPANGAFLTIAPIGSGNNSFEFVNNRSGNAIVKIRDSGSGFVVVSFFVAAGSAASFDRLPDGVFRIQYALGQNLAQGCRSFAHAYAIFEIPGAETFHNQKLTYTLLAEASRAGNSHPNPITVESFDAK